MHRSRLSTFVIDCQAQDVEEAARFWGAALGRAVTPDPKESNYRMLASRPEEALLLVQKVEHPRCPCVT